MRKVAFGFLGTTLDAYGGFGEKRLKSWRPSVSLALDPTLKVTKLVLWFGGRFEKLALLVKSDIENGSKGKVEVVLHKSEITDPWNFDEVYSFLFDYASHYEFKPEEEEYLVHLTTGTHVAQICLFLLTESRHFPAKLVQANPRNDRSDGSATIIDLDLSQYDRISQRFEQKLKDDLQILKAGINTRNVPFNSVISEIELVARSSVEPLLLLGPTGAGKSQLAKQIYVLKRSQHSVKGEFVEVNCATLRGEHAMSTLFGHAKGAFTGAVSAREGLLKKAHGGLLFLDEIGELGLDEQAMLLRALEEKRFLPLGSDKEESSNFQFIAGTNRDLIKRVNENGFREDLLQRINTWSFTLPALKDRREDIEPNLEYETKKFEERSGRRITFSSEAKKLYLDFALSHEATWPGNFRDLNASVIRMATFAVQGRITESVVKQEIVRLRNAWHGRREEPESGYEILKEYGVDTESLDLFDCNQLKQVLETIKRSRSLAEAGRHLFSVSRLKRGIINDTDRLKKYLARFGIDPRNLLSK